MFVTTLEGKENLEKSYTLVIPSDKFLIVLWPQSDLLEASAGKVIQKVDLYKQDTDWSPSSNPVLVLWATPK